MESEAQQRSHDTESKPELQGVVNIDGGRVRLGFSRRGKR